MNCQHQNIETVLTPELTHHGKRVCEACGKFFGWVKKPETIEREQVNAGNIVRLRNDSRLTKTEKAFIDSVDGQGPKLSPKQQEWLTALAAKYR